MEHIPIRIDAGYPDPRAFNSEYIQAITVLHAAIASTANAKLFTKAQKDLIRHKILFDLEDFQFLGNYPYWTVVKDGRGNLRATSCVAQNTKYLHRELLGDPAGMIVDHKNRIPLDNRRNNLRECSVGQNNWNRGKLFHTELPRGINKLPSGNYRVRVGFNGIYKNVGTFTKLEDAIEARTQAVKTHHGEFAHVSN